MQIWGVSTQDTLSASVLPSPPHPHLYRRWAIISCPSGHSPQAQWPHTQDGRAERCKERERQLILAGTITYEVVNRAGGFPKQCQRRLPSPERTMQLHRETKMRVRVCHWDPRAADTRVGLDLKEVYLWKPLWRMKEEAEEGRKSRQNHDAGLTPMNTEGQGRAPHSRVGLRNAQPDQWGGCRQSCHRQKQCS